MRFEVALAKDRRVLCLQAFLSPRRPTCDVMARSSSHSAGLRLFVTLIQIVMAVSLPSIGQASAAGPNRRSSLIQHDGPWFMGVSISAFRAAIASPSVVR